MSDALQPAAPPETFDQSMWRRFWELEAENRRLRAAMELDAEEGPLARTKENWIAQRGRIAELKTTVRRMQLEAEEKNRWMQATNYFVACTGCSTAPYPDPAVVDDEFVRKVEVVARRLSTWWANRKGRMAREAEA